MSGPVRTGIVFVLIFAALIALSIPYVARDKTRVKREETVRILATIAMAKTAYAVENELRDGSAITMEQLLAPRPANPGADDSDTTAATVKLPRLGRAPVFPYTKDEGELILEPIGMLPVFKLKNGETIAPKIERSQATPGPEY